MRLERFRIGRLVCHHRFGFLLGFYDGFAKNAFQGVDLVLDIIAELEGGDHSLFDLDGFTRAGIPCRARLAGLAGERTETADFDGVAFDEFFTDKVKKLFYDNFDIVAHKSSGLGDFLNKVLFSNIGHVTKLG